MEFFLYLNQNTLELVQVIRQANYSIIEYDNVCSDLYVNGATKYPQKVLVICTDNIIKKSSDAKQLINKTITHEAMHIVHMCNNRRPIGLSIFELSNQKIKNIERSVSVGINTNYDIESEAYIVEDNPKQVIRYIKKFCF